MVWRVGVAPNLHLVVLPVVLRLLLGILLLPGVHVLLLGILRLQGILCLSRDVFEGNHLGVVELVVVLEVFQALRLAGLVSLVVEPVLRLLRHVSC